MKTKEFIFLLLPSALFLATALMMFGFSHAFYVMADTRNEEVSQRNSAEYIGKIQRGEIKVTAEQLITMLESSRNIHSAYYKMDTSFGRGMARLGWLIISGMVLQVYAIVRIRMELKGRIAPKESAQYTS